MFKQVFILSITAALLSGCASTEKVTPVGSEEFTTNLASSQAAIIDAINVQCVNSTSDITTLTAEVNTLKQQITDALAKQSQKMTEDAAALAQLSEPPQCADSSITDKIVLGAVESVAVDELKASFATRIDTGAESSSLDARNIVLFERNGVQWVRFDVMTNGEGQPGNTYEHKVERFVRIKQDADMPDDRRPVIHAHLTIGQYAAETDLNLTDRSHLDYPLLLGRKFMKDIAVVDVGQNYIHGKNQKQVTTKVK
ncbi:ATP-dependent zinc protease family protein [Shewanella donghaensis]|uniref:ATP-dependent zinc protease family protein n=1 Tax=Shewanella donghaensis TaxID=238836 RepID=UPI001183B6EB|nr:ATP-dependent zinc protease [Shewanella donghaensis]